MWQRHSVWSLLEIKSANAFWYRIKLQDTHHKYLWKNQIFFIEAPIREKQEKFCKRNQNFTSKKEAVEETHQWKNLRIYISLQLAYNLMPGIRKQQILQQLSFLQHFYQWVACRAVSWTENSSLAYWNPKEYLKHHLSAPSRQEKKYGLRNEMRNKKTTPNTTLGFKLILTL